MARDNITNHSMRLNLDNEQHLRVHNVLKDLNTGIHKSVNQFLIDAADFYIRSFDEEGLTNEAEKRKQEGKDLIRRSDIADIKKEIQGEVKDEIIRVLGFAMAGGQTASLLAKKPEEKEEFTEKMQEDSIMAGLASKWG